MSRRNRCTRNRAGRPYVTYLHNLGLSHAAAGDFPTAQACYERALRIAPGHTEILLALCQITPQELSPDIQAMLSSLEKNIAVFDKDHQADVFFALAKLQGHQKNYRRTFDYYSKANRGRSARWAEMDISVDAGRVQELIQGFTPNLCVRLKQV